MSEVVPALQGRARLLTIQRGLREVLGAEVLADLHRPRPWLDWGTLLAVAATITLNIYLLATATHWLMFLLLFVWQGVVLHMLALINHDYFVHRRFGGRRLGRTLSLLTTTLLLIPNTGYEKAHRGHHVHIGSDDDPENYKQDINTFWRRLLFLTFPGMVMATSGRWGAPRREPYMGVPASDRENYRRAQIETWMMRAWLVALLPLAYLFPYPVLFGYFLPAIVMVPILNTIRILLEHADVEPQNPYAIGTFYRTGWFTGFVYLWSSGDGHIVHHVFPNIPYYNIPRALKLLVPVLVEKGVIERTSLATLVRGWFVDLNAHRSPWPAPEGKPSAPAKRPFASGSAAQA